MNDELTLNELILQMGGDFNTLNRSGNKYMAYGLPFGTTLFKGEGSTPMTAVLLLKGEIQKARESLSEGN